MKVEKIECFGWKNCIRIKNELIEAIVTTDIGPRILSLRTINGENLYKVMDDTLGKMGGDGFTFYGGHRLWYAPELENTYIQDNDAIEYKTFDNGAEFIANIEKKTGLRKSFKVSLDKNCMRIDHKIENTGDTVVELSAWGLCAFDGGLLIVPNGEWENGFMSNRSISLWKYTRMNDPRVYWGDKYITVSFDPAIEHPFKFGMSVDKEWVASFIKNTLLVKTFDFHRDRAYPNGSCNFETYTHKLFTEIESLTPLVTISKGQSVAHTERIYLYEDITAPNAKDENEIDQKLRAWTDRK